MPKIRVNLKKPRDNSYTIQVKTGLFAGLPELISGLKAGIASWAVISDDNVADLFGDKLVRAMRRAGLKSSLVTFPAGERSKSRRALSRIQDKLFMLGMGRDSALVALGGGVTGDLTGFVAATYMRGIPFVQVPTTLLAMVDSSVGGKTGIDVPAGKNLVGAFHQPVAVFIDPELLKTLPGREMRSGMAEVVKHAVIADVALFDYLEKKAGALIDKDPVVLEKVIAVNCAIKARVVERDERESGLRQVLNYGHTVGHALELLSRYRLDHGRAVAIGMAVEGEISRRMKMLPEGDLRRQNELLRTLGFKLRVPKRYKPVDILHAMGADKKVRGGKVRMALPERLGKMAQGKGGAWALSPDPGILRKSLYRATS